MSKEDVPMVQSVGDFIEYLKDPDCAEDLVAYGALDLPFAIYTGSDEYTTVLSTYVVEMGDGSKKLYIDVEK